jgi:hypothetical protein
VRYDYVVPIKLYITVLQFLWHEQMADNLDAIIFLAYFLSNVDAAQVTLAGKIPITTLQKSEAITSTIGRRAGIFLPVSMWGCRLHLPSQTWRPGKPITLP